MPRFAANLSLLYTELDFLDRFEAAARDGFKAVEFLFPYEYDAAQTARQERDELTQKTAQYSTWRRLYHEESEK